MPQDLIAPRRPNGPHRWWRAATSSLLTLTCLGTVTGCAASGSRGQSYQPRTTEARDRVLAEKLCDEAETLLSTDPVKAEELLLAALDADVFSGRAHNNVGVLYLDQGRLYDAATAFEAARRLLPENPDPRLNLGLTLERAGRVDEAIDAFEMAHNLNPHHFGALQALARAQLRYGRADDRTPNMLAEIALRGDDAWRSWAVMQAAHLDRASEGDMGPR